MVQVYNDGLRNMNLLYILHKLAIPAVCLLGMVLALPYAVARTIVPLLGQFSVRPSACLSACLPVCLSVCLSA